MAKVAKRPLYNVMNGVMYPAMFSPKCFREALEYKAQPEDVFIITYPKCGTTWMQNVALYIFRKGRELDNITDFLRMTPFIDMIGKESIDKMPRPGAMKSHLPYNHMPYSPEAKYVFVARNPKDCCVSFFHHAKNEPGFGYWDGEFNDFFELFMAGELEYNDYFDHLLSWYPHRNDSNVFYTTYETMKKDTKGVVVKLAKFLGKEYIDAIEKDNAVLNNILLFSGFDYMKKNLSKIYDMKRERDISSLYSGLKHVREFTKSLNVPKDFPETEFVRKGVVGDWKNFFNPDQTERLNQKFTERMEDTEVVQWFNMEA